MPSTEQHGSQQIPRFGWRMNNKETRANHWWLWAMVNGDHALTGWVQNLHRWLREEGSLRPLGVRVG